MMLRQVEGAFKQWQTIVWPHPFVHHEMLKTGVTHCDRIAIVPFWLENPTACVAPRWIPRWPMSCEAAW